MFREHRTALRSDFEAVKALLTQRRRYPTVDSHLEIQIRRAHHLTYSLMLWSYSLDTLPERGAVFLRELASDAMQFLPNCLDGYSKTPLLLARGVIENAARHIYFMDHAVEFARFSLNEFRASPSDLFSYIGDHPDFRACKEEFDGRSALTNAYGELSEHIHGSQALHEQLRLSPAEIVFDGDIFRKQVEILDRAATACNFALALQHRSAMRIWMLRDRSIVLRTMPKAARRAVALF